MKTPIAKLTELTFTLSNPTRAVVRARGETPTAGWTNPELGNERSEGGVTHVDFLAEPPERPAGDVVTPIAAERIFFLQGEPQQVIVHSKTNALSVELPRIGDPQ